MSLYDVNGNVVATSGGGGLGEDFGVTEVVETGVLNLLTDYEYTDGIWLNGNGVETKNALHTTSEKIHDAIGKEIQVYFTKANYKFGVMCYGENDAFLGSVNANDGNYSVAGETYTITPIDGSAYIRVTLGISARTGGNIVPTISGIVTEYCDFIDTNKRKMIPLQKRTEHENHMAALDALLWNYTKWNGKVIVADGNSLVDSTNWIAPMGEILGAEVVNIGKSGGAITRPDQPSTDATIEEKRQYIIDNVANNYPAKADLILLQESSYLDGEPSDQMDGDSQSTSWMARMNYLIRCLKAKYPNVLIVLMPDNPWYSGNSAAGGNDSESLSGVNDQYLTTRNRDAYEAMKKLAEYNRLAFWHIDNSTPFNPLYLDNYYSRYYNLIAQYPDTTQDGVHPYNYDVAKGYAMAHWAAGLIINPDAPNDAIDGWQDNLVTYEATTE